MRSTSLSTLLIVSIVAFSLISCGGGASSSGGADGADGTDGTGGAGGAGGAGGVNTPITCRQDGFTVISDIDGLKAIGENTASMAKNYCLTANIDLASATGVDSGFPLGWTSNTDITPFTGNFDGEGHIISNLVIDNDAGNYMGLFAKIIPGTGKSSEIKDLTLNAFGLTGFTYVGALAGLVDGSVTISKIIAQEVRIIGKSTQTAHIGGLLGSTLDAVKIMDSSATGDVTGEGHNIGGLVGFIGNKGMISNSYAAVTVVGKGDKIGGLAGYIDGGADLEYYATISNSYATGDVGGNEYLGGLIGHSHGIKVSNSYSTGNVNGNDKVGGFIGYMLPSNEVSNSYSTGKVKATGTNKGGFIGQLALCTNVKCKITNSYFDKSGINSGINPIGSGGGAATTTGLVGVVGAGDIKGDGATPVVYKTIDGDDVIFDGWSVDDWKFADGQWPILEWQTKTLSAGVVNQPMITNPICKKNPTYEAVQDVAGLKAIGDDSVSMAKNYCLTRSIDLGGVTSGFPLGWTSNSDITDFIGNFDGEGHTISNLTIDKSNDGHMGLFARIGNSINDVISIKDLNLDYFNVSGKWYVGSLAGGALGVVSITNVKVIEPTLHSTGYNYDGFIYSEIGGLIGQIDGKGTVTDSSVIGGTVTGIGDYVGGLIGSSDISTILNSYATVSVTGGHHVGGLVGYIIGSRILNSYATGAVNGGSNVGGLVGYHKEESTVSNCYATGDVTGISGVGGLTGDFSEGDLISNSYATGKVTGAPSGDKGGLIGASGRPSVCKLTNNYFNASVNSEINPIGSVDGTATDTAAGVMGVAGKRAIALDKDGTSHLLADDDTKIFDGWSTDDWKFAAGNWPILKWQAETLSTITSATCTAQDYVAVYDAYSLKEMGKRMDKNYCLTEDIDLSSATGFPLGWTSNADITPFTGNLDGAGHTISNLVIDNSAGNDIGLFSKIIPGTGKSSEIKDLTLNTFGLTGTNSVGALAGLVDGSVTISKVIAKNANINGVSADTGGLIGYIKNGVEIIDSNTVKGTINATNAEDMDYQIGGLIGKAEQSNIAHSYSSGDVGTDNSNNYNIVSGGLVGLVKGDKAAVSNSYSTGAVKASDTAGGLVGIIEQATVSNSYATGTVEADDRAGGLVGFIKGKDARVSNSYAIGDVIEGKFKGGLVGSIINHTVGIKITNSYYDEMVSEISPVGGSSSQHYLTKVLVRGKDDIVLKSDGKFYVKSTGTAVDDSDDEQIFVDWDATIWQIMAGEWPTFK